MQITRTGLLIVAVSVSLLCSLPLCAQSVSSNGPACTGVNLPTAGCNAAQQILRTNPTNYGAQTLVPDPLPANISTSSVHNYLYPGATTRVIAEYQPWFCNSSSPYCNGHLNIGMDTSNASQVLRQAQFMKTVGVDVANVDYYGCTTFCGQDSSGAFEYSSTAALANAISGNPSTTPKFSIMIDAGAILGSGTGRCPGSSSPSETCIEAALNLQMDYLCNNWLYQSYYEVNPANSHPIVLLFLNQAANWPGTNFNTVFGVVAAHATAGQSCGSGTYTTTVDFVDENAGAFTETGIAGGFAWVQPLSWSITNQLCYQGASCSVPYLAGFYSTARANSGKLAIGAIYKGFDDNNATWGSNRVLAQQCGQVLNLTASAISTAGYSSSSQLAYVQIATWNDDEEGTGVEMGVNNCIIPSAPTISGGMISWTQLQSDPTYASTSTILSQSIYTGTPGSLTLYVSGLSPSATSYSPAPTLGVGQHAYIYNVGQPLILNQLSIFPSQGPLYPNFAIRPRRQINIFNPPLNSHGANWSDFQIVLADPRITGTVAFIPNSCTGSGCTNALYLDSGTGVDVGGVNYCPSLSAGLTQLDAFVATVGSFGKLANLVITPAGYGNNSQTAAGVFSQAWANLLDTDCLGNPANGSSYVYRLDWQPNHHYLPGEYILASGVYWQIQTGCGNYNGVPNNVSASNSGGPTTVVVTVNATPTILTGQSATFSLSIPSLNAINATVTVNSAAKTLTYTIPASVTVASTPVSGDVTGDATCTSGGSLPTFSGSSVTDGTAPTLITWINTGANAPLQDVWVGSGYKGKANQFYSLPLSTTANQQIVGTTATVTLLNPFIGIVGTKITVSGVPAVGSAGNLNCTNCVTTAISTSAPWTVAYTDTNGALSPTTVTAGTLSSQRHVNEGSLNASTNISTLVTGLPTPYEPPVKTVNEYICGQVYARYSNNPNVGYIRCGFSVGGEADVVGLTGTSPTNWPFGSQAVFQSYYNQYISLISNDAVSSNILCMGNLSTFALPQAQMSRAVNCGIGTNGYQANDVIGILAGNCLLIGAIQGNWCFLFNEYNVPGPNGNYPVLELQTGSVNAGGNGTSTPCLDSAGNTGSLSPEPSSCTAFLTWPGLMHQAKLDNTNDFEAYFLDTGMVGDTAGYPTLPGASTQCQGGIGAVACQALYQAPYIAAFIDFLGSIPGSAQFTINVTGAGTGSTKIGGPQAGTVKLGH